MNIPTSNENLTTEIPVPNNIESDFPEQNINNSAVLITAPVVKTNELLSAPYGDGPDFFGLFKRVEDLEQEIKRIQKMMKIHGIIREE